MNEDIQLVAKNTETIEKQYMELEKFERVLSKMTPRFLDVVSISDIEGFINDLNEVLKEEKAFRKDDLSLYYLIDKKHSVSSEYVPQDLIPLKKNDLFSISRNDLSLRPEAYAALEELSAAALEDGIKLLVSSTYRSYKYQEGLFNRYVSQDGLELAERYSARPGTSQHQLGVAVDFGSITDDWGDTKMGKWVYDHASDYGWSLSFPKGYEDVTGYMWECWHFRYIGKTACNFQEKWFGNVQQFMFEFIDAWKNDSSSDFSA
ncbi:MAG: M15 family metallopeptidase [Treponema sp.]|nr:M15 family metallopeptidase [Treponema sp.]